MLVRNCMLCVLSLASLQLDWSTAHVQATIASRRTADIAGPSVHAFQYVYCAVTSLVSVC
jgi:hypothetical protein